MAMLPYIRYIYVYKTYRSKGLFYCIIIYVNIYMCRECRPLVSVSAESAMVVGFIYMVPYE